jgi:hypothetical protein
MGDDREERNDRIKSKEQSRELVKEGRVERIEKEQSR